VTEERWRTFVIQVPRYSPVTRDDSSRREATARSPLVQLIPSITMAFVQVCRGDVQLGAPIRFSIYTANGRLLLNRGCCISSEAQLERLFDVGAYRDDNGPGARNGSGSARSILISSANHRPAPSAATAITVDFPALTQALDCLQLTVEGVDKRSVQTAYVGTVKGSALIVTAPKDDELLQPGVVVQAKMIFGRDVYTFGTRVTARHAAPSDLVVLAHPEKVVKHRVRRHRRVETRVAARVIRNDAVAAGYDATVVNVSIDGLQLSLRDTALMPGEHFKLALRLPTDGKTHAVLWNCVARNVRRKKDGVLVGAEFGARTDEAKVLLKDFIFEMATGTAF